MKQILSIFILLSIVALQLPKGLYHDHTHGKELYSNHQHTESHHEELAKYSSVDNDLDGLEIDNEDCNVCDLQLDSFDGPEIPLRYAQVKLSSEIEAVYTSQIESKDLFDYSLRGPPMVG